MKLLRAKKGGKDRFYLLLSGEEFSALRALREFDAVEEDKGLLKRVVFAYLFLFAGALAVLLAPSSEPPRKAPSSMEQVNEIEEKPALGKGVSLIPIEDVKKIAMREGASSGELQSAYASVKEYLKRCGKCDARDELTRIEGALMLRIDERFRNLRFQAEKALRQGEVELARRMWKEIITLIQDKEDKRYIYAVKRLERYR